VWPQDVLYVALSGVKFSAQIAQISLISISCGFTQVPLLGCPPLFLLDKRESFLFLRPPFLVFSRFF